MARAATSRNLKGFNWLTKKRVTYRRHVGKERQVLKRQAFEERKERIALKRLAAQERMAEAQLAAADRKIAAAEQKTEVAEKKLSKGAMAEAQFEAIKARMEKEIQAQERHKAAVMAKNPSCARTRKSTVTDRAKRYRANQRGCKPKGVKKCRLCGSKSDLMVDHIDGNESNGRKSNLRWLCRSCNTLVGAEMARTGEGRRTVQYNPGTGGAKTLGEYIQAVLQHTRGAHDDGGRIIHETPKSRRRQFASEIWSARHSRGTAGHGSASAGHDEPGWVSNPERSTEYQLGYSLGQRDRETASLRRTSAELEATFRAKFDPARASTLTFAEGYEAGYGARNPYACTPEEKRRLEKQIKSGKARLNPESGAQDDGSEEYQQALRTAELFHGRPVKEQIEVEDSVRTHDWYVSIGPLIKLIIKPVTKKPKARVPLPFHQSESGTVQLFCSPDGLQFYLRGGDQELDLKAFGMGEGSAWYRDHMIIGEAVEITYRDRKKFHSFKLVDYFHKLGEETKKKPAFVYDSFAKKMSIIGGQYRIEMEDLVDGMSPGIVN